MLRLFHQHQHTGGLVVQIQQPNGLVGYEVVIIGGHRLGFGAEARRIMIAS